jgi:hypothetical protein
VSLGIPAIAVDRNVRHFLWYGGVAGDGLRSVGAGHVSQPRACALSCPSPAIRGPECIGPLTRPAVPLYCTAGPLCMPGLYNAPGRAAHSHPARPSQSRPPDALSPPPPRSWCTRTQTTMPDDTGILRLEHLALPRGGVKRSTNGHLADAFLPSRMLLIFRAGRDATELEASLCGYPSREAIKLPTRSSIRANLPYQLSQNSRDRLSSPVIPTERSLSDVRKLNPTEAAPHHLAHPR